MKLRVLYADDEPLARQRLADLLAAEEEVEVVAACDDGEEAAQAILAERPDVVLLDVQMPGMTGFDVVEAIGPEELPVVVFVTAHDEFALRAFDAHAVDYLLKPVAPERFRAMIQRARAQVDHRRDNGEIPDLQALLRTLAARSGSGYPDRFAVRVGHRLIFVRVSSVDWIGAEGNYAALHAGKQSHLIRETMSALERKLDPRRFLRIHRSTIVNLDRVREIQSLSNRAFVLVLEDGTKLESSGGYRHRIQEWIDRSA
ncbi:MAG TPA: LytTR family DNA-binding domain-containing protein [Longimicrobiaceae bacterium]